MLTFDKSMPNRDRVTVIENAIKGLEAQRDMLERPSSDEIEAAQTAFLKAQENGDKFRRGLLNQVTKMTTELEGLAAEFEANPTDEALARIEELEAERKSLLSRLDKLTAKEAAASEQLDCAQANWDEENRRYVNMVAGFNSVIDELKEQLAQQIAKAERRTARLNRKKQTEAEWLVNEAARREMAKVIEVRDEYRETYRKMQSPAPTPAKVVIPTTEADCIAAENETQAAKKAYEDFFKAMPAAYEAKRQHRYWDACETIAQARRDAAVEKMNRAIDAARAKLPFGKSLNVTLPVIPFAPFMIKVLEESESLLRAWNAAQINQSDVESRYVRTLPESIAFQPVVKTPMPKIGKAPTIHSENIGKRFLMESARRDLMEQVEAIRLAILAEI